MAEGPLETVRLDRWLWAVRAVKTRSAAADACRGGHVRLNGKRAKAAAPVRVGDRVEARLGSRHLVWEVTGLVERRVGAPLAAECYLDHSPPPPPSVATAPVPVRDKGAGRPTKKDRRRLDASRGRR
jgi:ribosome-associated heat shock protein Hsp15